jgi:Fe-S cluster assembly iron-binding protein IscA
MRRSYCLTGITASTDETEGPDRMSQEILGRPRYSITLTDRAIEKLTQLLENEKPGVALRVSVEPGGCSGLRYQLFFTDEYAKILAENLDEATGQGLSEAGDKEEEIQRAAMIKASESVVWYGEFAVLISKMSGPYLVGAEIDYHDTVEKQGFMIANARGSCGCGSSFQ